MKYKITMSNGDKFKIPESEAVSISKGESKGLVFVPSLKGFINLSFLISAIPENKIDKSQMTAGYLHDGTKAIKHFGVWCDANNPEVKINPDYYPEIINNNLLPVEDYENDNENKLLGNNLPCIE